MRPLAVLGSPSSAASYAAGQDRAPAALRAAGLVAALTAAGRDVVDLGDVPAQVWRPDRENPHAQNVTAVVENLRSLHERLVPALRDGGAALVLGGNCTVALAAAAAVRDAQRLEPTVLYFDRQFDLNTPRSTADGALDWMGLAHALALPGCVDAVADALGPRPLLRAERIAWLGVDPDLATPWEREQAAALGLRVTERDELARDPVGAVTRALAGLPAGPRIVHLDVDVLDFTDAPLAENTDGRNTGPTLDALGPALAGAADGAVVLSVGELNPTRSAGDPDALPRFVRVLAAAAGGLRAPG